MLYSCLFGVGMLIPMQRGAGHTRARAALRSAHLDWLMLGLMEGLAAALCMLFALRPPGWVIAGLIFGAWPNPVPYVFRAVGIDAFRFRGGFVQRLAAALGALSSGAILVGWTALVVLAIRSDVRPW